MINITKFIALVSILAALVSCSSVPSDPAVRLTHGVDDSAGGLSAYIVEIHNATFYLEKSGGGLSSILDNDEVDWLGFYSEAGSGWKGEYRGFPNAIHKQDGSYFHAMNAGTDPSSSVVTINTVDHVQIVFTSDNGEWEGTWDFYPDRCDFTMSKVSSGYQYWVQYEGVPGGAMDKDDFWYNSATSQKQLINEPFKGDLPAPEWYAFGDARSSRMLFMLHHENDEHPDDYVSRPYMTVLGFGRREKNKYLTQPNRFSIGFIESTDYVAINESMKSLVK